MAAKDKIAATLLNHWYCLSRAEELGKIKNKPNVKAYQEKLDGVDKLDEKVLKAAEAHFHKQNCKLSLGIFNNLLKNAGLVGATVEMPARAKSFSLSVPITGFKFDEINKIVGAIKMPAQLNQVMEIVQNLTLGIAGDNDAVITHEAKLAQNYDSLFVIENSIREFITSSAHFVEICKFIKSTVKPEEFEAIKLNQINVVFKFIKFENHKLVEAAIETCETEEVKANRELKARLEEALRRRIKKVKDLSVSDGSITFSFEDSQTSPLTFDLDVLTDW